MSKQAASSESIYHDTTDYVDASSAAKVTAPEAELTEKELAQVNLQLVRISTHSFSPSLSGSYAYPFSHFLTPALALTPNPPGGAALQE